jgi:hypothetical protein
VRELEEGALLEQHRALELFGGRGLAAEVCAGLRDRLRAVAAPVTVPELVESPTAVGAPRARASDVGKGAREAFLALERSRERLRNAISTAQELACELGGVMADVQKAGARVRTEVARIRSDPENARLREEITNVERGVVRVVLESGVGRAGSAVGGALNALRRAVEKSETRKAPAD